MKMLVDQAVSPSLPRRNRSGALPALLRQLRIKQWVKNLACLAGLIFSQQLFDPIADARALLGFFIFSFMASAVYIVNDYFDRHRDRLNPRTAKRPLASGDLPIWLALCTCAVLVALATAGALWLSVSCLVVSLTYAGLNIFYSLKIKRTVIADVFCIALGFVFRVLFGAFAVNRQPTAWIVLCMFFLALFLGFGKRRAELAGQGETAQESARPVLAKYRVEYLDLLMGVTASLTVLSYALFTVAASRNPTLVITVVPVVYCVFRYLLLVIVHSQGESPEGILTSDRMLWVGMAAWVVLCVVFLYCDIHLFLESPVLSR